MAKRPNAGPKVLVFDIETAPIKAFVWKLWDENVALSQIVSDWHLLSWAAKWLDSPKVLYMDQRHEKDIENDRRILQGLWELLNSADVVVTQNGKKFDVRKVNARFAIHGMPPPSPYRQIDTKELAKKNFGFTANSLEYLADKLGGGRKKEKSRKFAGFDLWKECLTKNPAAFREMEKYNKADVLATEALYKRLAPWGGTGTDLNVYRSLEELACQCGSQDLIRQGFSFTRTGKFQRFQCRACGAWTSERGYTQNLLSPKKQASLKRRSS